MFSTCRLRRLLLALVALSSGLAGCRVDAGAKAPVPPRVAVAQSAAPAPESAPPPASKAPAVRAAGGSPHVDLPASIDWQTWEAGVARARAENKPVMLLVWANWCARCRELAPAFGEPEIVELAKKVVMVQQNADDRPAWLSEKFDSLYGGYVPRVFVLRPDGSVRTDITSGNPKYPYFYVPQDKRALADSLKKALSG